MVLPRPLELLELWLFLLLLLLLLPLLLLLLQLEKPLALLELVVPLVLGGATFLLIPQQPQQLQAWAKG